MVKWIAFFSQTGSEIVRISNALKRTPNLIVTNNKQEKIKHDDKIGALNSIIMTGTHDQIMDYFSRTYVHDPKETIITLHGYLRIIRPDVVKRYEMYNGHPALFNKYPELKGKDPQERTWENMIQYPSIGSVVHCVNDLVDDGDIVAWVEKESTHVTEKVDLYKELMYTSEQSWLNFLRKRFDENWDKRGSIGR